MADSWDAWLGELALSGADPRQWDLNRVLAAFEVSLRRGAKDEKDWQRLQSQLTAEPPEVRARRREETRKAALSGRTTPGRGIMSVDAAEALMARFAAADAAYS